MKKLIPSLIIIGAVKIYFVTFWFEQPTVVLLGVALASAVLFWFVGLSKQNVILYLSVGVGGFLAEAISVWGGAWSYATPHLLGLPIWLPLLWGATGLAIVHWYKALTEK